MKTPVLAASFLAVAVVSGLVSGGAVALLLDDGDTGSEPAAVVEGSPSPTRTATTGGVGALSSSDVAEMALQSVVTVFNEAEPRIENGVEVLTVNSGSGVVINSGGLILTNEHVVHEPGTLSVVLNTGEQRPAVLLAHDAPFTDMAILQIPEGGLVAMPFGDSAELEVGEPVLAIGSALYEFGNSVTAGIVSGLQRRFLRDGIYQEDLIQTDAAVNTGNSGGPLVTLDGRMVGLVSSVVRRVGGVEEVTGVSFAISTRTLAPIIDSMTRTGSFPRPEFGIEHVDLDPQIAADLGVPVSRGAVVVDVAVGGPAGNAGIQTGDIIVAVGGIEIVEGFTFLNTLAVLAPDALVEVVLLRDEAPLSVSVQLEPRA